MTAETSSEKSSSLANYFKTFGLLSWPFNSIKFMEGLK